MAFVTLRTNEEALPETGETQPHSAPPARIAPSLHCEALRGGRAKVTRTTLLGVRKMIRRVFVIAPADAANISNVFVEVKRS